MSHRRATAKAPRTLIVPPLEPRPGRRGPFACTWWGNSWVTALEGPYGGDGRLTRGRTYARSGAVGAITVTPSRIEAKVSGSRRTPYRTEVVVPELDAAAWDRLLERIAANAAHIAALLDREIPEAIEREATAARAELLPALHHFDYFCSCPDRGHPCKHAAALCYQFARLLDTHPFALFLVRGRGEAELLEDLQQRNAEQIAVEAPPAAPAEPDSVLAREAFARARDGLPALPALPAPPQAAGPVPVLTGGPAPGDGIAPEALERLAADAATRALHLYTDAQHGGPTPEAWQIPPLWHDIVRWAATDPGIHAFMRLSHASGRDPYTLAQAARAWRHGGPAGLAALEDDFTPDPAQLAHARHLIDIAWEDEKPPRLRRTRNRWTVVGHDAQLRLGRDGRWYPYRKEDGRWWPAGAPGQNPATVLTEILNTD